MTFWESQQQETRDKGKRGSIRRLWGTMRGKGGEGRGGGGGRDKKKLGGEEEGGVCTWQIGEAGKGKQQ